MTTQAEYEDSEREAILREQEQELKESFLEKLLGESWWIGYLQQKYVQRADPRQRSMGLIYTEAETHDLAKEICNGIRLKLQQD